MPQSPEPRRLGVFGGTFDPIHVGHLVAGQEVLEALSLDRLLFVPARRSPHKADAPVAGDSLRIAMIREAVGEQETLVAEGMELDRPAPSYTVETLRALVAREAGARLFLVLGVDQWESFGRWREPREIARLAELVVVTREGERPEGRSPVFEDGPPPEFREVPVTRIDISSTLVRSRVRDARSIRFLVPRGVRRIIEAEQLYR